jgi:hypothetical protein
MTREAAGTATGEAALIRRASAGDASAFETLIAPRLDHLYRTAWAILGHESDARDATLAAGALKATVTRWLDSSVRDRFGGTSRR